MIQHTEPRVHRGRKVEKMTIVTNDYVVRGRHFTIVKETEGHFAGFYHAIEDKYITDGRLNKTLNGAQLHASKELNTCLNNTRNSVEIDYLIEQGYSKAEAFAKVFDLDVEDLPERLFA